MAILHIVGTRPNFVKAAAVFHALQERGIQQWLIHTGQHHDFKMSESFFQELQLPVPDAMLECYTSLDLAEFNSKVFEGISTFSRQKQPRLAVVYGDVNSTLAAALACHKLNLPIAHIEAGLRSFDNTMPEENNRYKVDHLSSWLFTTEPSANENLTVEGVPSEKVFFVGNCMIDTLQRTLPSALQLEPWKEFGLSPGKYLLCTLHRPGNVDSPDELTFITTLLAELGKIIPVIFPVHPRTRQRMELQELQLEDSVICCEPLPYRKFIGLMAKAAAVLTDSGGVQEETTWLGVPCLTLRPNTERPVTIEKGTNFLLPYNVQQVQQAVEKILAGEGKKGGPVELWDGKAGARIAQYLVATLQSD